MSLEHVQNQSDNGEYVGMIGNLLPLTDAINNSAGSKTFDQKREIYKRSQLATVKEFLTEHGVKDSWSDGDIKARTDKIAEVVYEKVWLKEIKI